MRIALQVGASDRSPLQFDFDRAFARVVEFADRVS